MEFTLEPGWAAKMTKPVSDSIVLTTHAGSWMWAGPGVPVISPPRAAYAAGTYNCYVPTDLGIQALATLAPLVVLFYCCSKAKEKDKEPWKQAGRSWSSFQKVKAVTCALTSYRGGDGLVLRPARGEG